MKKIFLLALAALPAITFAQQSGQYRLNGKVSRLDTPARAYLIRIINGGSVTDSTTIHNGIFQFNGTTTDITWATLIIDHTGKGISGRARTQDAKNLYIAQGEFSITTSDSIKYGIITGSAVNKDSGEYDKAMAAIDKSIADAGRPQSGGNSGNGPGPEQTDIINKLVLEKQAVQKKYIITHPQSYFSLRALKEIMLYYDYRPITMPVYKEFSDLYNGLSATLRNSLEGKTSAFFLKGALLTEVGSPAPEFTENDVNDHPVKLSDFRGKYVLLDFWASWCKPCRAENPDVVKTYNHYKDKNFTILSVSLDRPGKKDSWLKAIQDDHLTWTNVSALNFWKSKAVSLYSVQGVPSNFLIGPSGKIIGKNLMGEALDEKLKEILGL